MDKAKLFRNACGKFATGVTIITHKTDNEVHGMTANGFMSVSLNPELVIISVGKKQRMHALLMDGKEFGVSILSESQENLSNHFAGKPDDNLNIQFDHIGGAAKIAGAIAYFIAEIKSKYDEGDHTLFVGRVTDFGVTKEDEKPLLFYSGKYKNISE